MSRFRTKLHGVKLTRHGAGLSSVNRQGDRDRPEGAIGGLHISADALPVSFAHESVERRETTDTHHDQITVLARGDIDTRKRGSLGLLVPELIALQEHSGETLATVRGDLTISSGCGEKNGREGKNKISSLDGVRSIQGYSVSKQKETRRFFLNAGKVESEEEITYSEGLSWRRPGGKGRRVG